MNGSVVIGVHGLRNKPPPQTLIDWWLRSILEGYARNLAAENGTCALQLAYWADIMHDPLVSPENDDEPYLPARGSGPLPRHANSLPGLLKGLGTELAGGLLDKLSAAPVATDFVDRQVAAELPDLHRYYNEDATRKRVRERLIARLSEAQRAQRRILLIAHSMGSIVAYDVLASAQRELPGLSVEHWITLGSPLGFNVVKERARAELRKLGVPDASRVPECVQRWTNITDRKDRYALDSLLHTDYLPNSRGVTVADVAVINGYIAPSGKANPHKIYGYLRTPELTLLIAGFLA